MNSVRLITILCAVMASPVGLPTASARTPPSSAPLALRADPASLAEASRALATLNATLLTGASATLTLDDWCRTQGLATSKVVAERLDVDDAGTGKARAILQVGPREPLRHRRVRLRCGTHVLSVADNWYVPARLQPEMNRLLDTTDTPFGRAVHALHFKRTILAADILWHPAPGERRATGPAVIQVPNEVMVHRAVLKVGDGRPISYVVEHYTSGVLDSFATTANRKG